MNTTKSKYDAQEAFAVPCEVMLEIAQIILQAELPHEIVEAMENKNQVVLSISYKPGLKLHQDALKNVSDVLAHYKDLRFGEGELTNWKDH